MTGVSRPLRRYASPIAFRNRTGDVDVRSLPSPESPAAMTRIFGLTAFSAS